MVLPPPFPPPASVTPAPRGPHRGLRFVPSQGLISGLARRWRSFDAELDTFAAANSYPFSYAFQSTPENGFCEAEVDRFFLGFVESVIDHLH